MSTWGVGDHHDSDEVRSLKEQLQIKDAAYATLNGEMLKREAELKELKKSFDDVLVKLRQDADRVVQLEADLKRRNEELSNEQYTRANSEFALTTAQRKLQDSERTALELQSTIDVLSSYASSSSMGRSKLEQDNTALQTRVRALEQELQNKTQAEEAALRQSRGPSVSASHHRLSTGESSRIHALETEVAELRTISMQQASELQRTTQQLTSTRDAYVQLQNDKMASERQLQRQLEAARAALEEREEDLRLLRDVYSGEDIAEREANLLERLEEEEKRVAALEQELTRSASSKKRDMAMLQEELQRTMHLLDDANKKAANADSKLMQLAKDRELALRDRERIQQEHDRLSELVNEASNRIRELEYRLSTSGPTSPVEQTADEATLATIERLLGAVERLRDERDGLRRDLEFLNAENRFAVQSLEAKLAVATSRPATPAVNNPTHLITLQGRVHASQEQAERSNRVALVIAIVAKHLGEDEEAAALRIQALLDELSAMREHLGRTEHSLQERQVTITSLEQQLSSTTGAVGDVETQVSGLRATIQRLEDELANERNSHTETGAALSDAEAQLTSLSQALTDAEAARDALALEKAHLEADLDSAKQDFADADARHTEQLTSLSAVGRSGQGMQTALKAQIRELQDRVQRRTEQIGVHQHDIKRLETNMKLQEERIEEMTQEMEVLQNQKVAMLEDCATAREERDEVTRRYDALEEAMEGLEEARMEEIEAVVKAAFDVMAKRRDIVIRHSRALATIRENRLTLEERLGIVEVERAALSAQIVALGAERDQLVRAVEDATSSTQAQLKEISAAARAAEEAKSETECQLVALRNELESRTEDLASLHDQLTTIRAGHADHQSIEASQFAQEKAALETRLQKSQIAYTELETTHQNLVQELRRVEAELKNTEDELACHLANGVAQSETEAQLREDILQVKQQHEKEVNALGEQLKVVSNDLETMSRLHEETEASKAALEEELLRSKQQLEARLAEAGETLNSATRLETELGQLKASHAEEVRALRGELDSASSELRGVTNRKDEIEALLEQAQAASQEHETAVLAARGETETLEAKLREVRSTYDEEIQELRSRLEDGQRELKELRTSTDAQQHETVDNLTRTIEELQGRLTVLTREADEYRAELEEEKAAHAQARASTAAELRELTVMHDEAEAALQEAEKELPAIRAQLEHAESSLREIQEEKLGLQYQVTNLEAEIQRAKSLERHMESQLAESERHIATLETELTELHTRYTSLDKLAKTTEANLAMQVIQHEQTIASLKRQLNALRSQPRLEDEVAELKEKNTEYEELLRAKCLEIEENDDKFIDMLKEKKKLTNKIDSLTRKVQNLQTKLTAATDAAAKATHASPPAPAPPPKPPTVFSPSPILAPAPIISGSSAASSRVTSTSRQRVVTAPATSSPDTATFQPPPMPTFRPKTPESRLRMMSGPASTSRPKTPEARAAPPPVFKARTPERHRIPTTSSLPEASSSTSLIGVKRRAPDDFDDCAAVPPQTFTVDSAPLGHTASGRTPSQPTTPRLRKALQTMRTGFTPVRHHGSTRGGSASPRRATTGASIPALFPHTITDVTNSPRAASQSDAGKGVSGKRGWLGKIRTGPSQSSRVVPPQQPVFGPPPGMR